MTLEELDKDINKKIAENEEFVRYTFFELKVRHNLSEDEIDELFEESIILPTQYEINEYKMMEDFIETIDNSEISNNLQRLIQGKGAFRRFKDYCIEMDIIQEWYNFRDKRYKEIAINWCKQNELEL